MSDSRSTFDIGHPAPARGRVPRWRLTFGLLGAPLAWSAQIGAASAVGGLACLTPAGASLGTAPTGTAAALIAINLVALAVAAAALAVSYGDLRRTHREEFERSGGVMEAGEGRTRFLCICGVWMSVLFLVATAASTISVVWNGACPG